MYESFFGFDRRPFSATPDAECFVACESIQNALEELIVCVESGQGIGIVTGPAGMGKTLLCERLADELDTTYLSVILTNSNFPAPRSLLQSILHEIGEPYNRLDEHELRLELSTVLRSARNQGHKVVLIIDEAHQLDERLLEEVRTITTLVDGAEPLVRVILSGQPELEETLTHSALNAFNQRVYCQVILEPLSRQESAQYVAERLEWAGISDTEEVFTSNALDVICHASDGSPRCLNQLCDHTLLLAYVAERIPANEETVLEALEDLKQLPLHWNIPRSLERSADNSTSDHDLDDELLNEPVDIDFETAEAEVDVESELPDVELTEADCAAEFVEIGAVAENDVDMPADVAADTAIAEAVEFGADIPSATDNQTEDSAETDTPVACIEVGADVSDSLPVTTQSETAAHQKAPAETHPDFETVAATESDTIQTDNGDLNTGRSKQTGSKQAETAVADSVAEKLQTTDAPQVEIHELDLAATTVAPTWTDTNDTRLTAFAFAPDITVEADVYDEDIPASGTLPNWILEPEMEPRALSNTDSKTPLEIESQAEGLVMTDAVLSFSSRKGAKNASPTANEFEEEIVYDRYAAIDARLHRSRTTGIVWDLPSVEHPSGTDAEPNAPAAAGATTDDSTTHETDDDNMISIAATKQTPVPTEAIEPPAAAPIAEIETPESAEPAAIAETEGIEAIAGHALESAEALVDELIPMLDAALHESDAWDMQQVFVADSFPVSEQSELTRRVEVTTSREAEPGLEERLHLDVLDVSVDVARALSMSADDVKQERASTEKLNAHPDAWSVADSIDEIISDANDDADERLQYDVVEPEDAKPTNSPVDRTRSSSLKYPESATERRVEGTHGSHGPHRPYGRLFSQLRRRQQDRTSIDG